MNAIGIVEALNSKLESLQCKEGVHFILHKTKEANLKFPAIKTFKYTLWYISDTTKCIVAVLSITDRITTDNEEKIVTKRLEEELLSTVFSLLLDPNNLTLILDGRFKGFDTDQ